MSKRVKSLDEIRESRLLFDKNPPAFGYILITVVAVFLIVAVVWSIKTPKVYTIQAQGTVTNDESNYVMCSYTGEILDSNMEEGALVEAGDVLFTIKSTDYDLQQTQLEDNRKSYEEQISQYSLLIKSIKDDTNYFDETKADDGLYWSLFETYKSQVEQNKVDVSTYQAYGYTDEQIQAQLETNQGKIDEVYYSAIQSAEAKIAEADQQSKSIDAQLAAVSGGQDSYEVKATASGVLHMLGNYKSGMVVQTTTTVATITPENSQRYLEAYVSTSDMARMHEGDREQAVSYKSTNTSVAAVSGSGVVTAKQTGSSTIIVSNGDLSGAVSVIVNRDTESSVAEPAADSTEAENTSEQIFDENTDVSETPVISEQMLYELYTAGRSMKVIGDGYSIIIDGKKIVNYKNELNTDIELERTGDSIKFNLNDGEYLCGEVTLHIDDVKGKYLYLYNNVKHKYELVSTEDMSGLNLSTPGKYMITAKPIREGSAAVRYILIAGGIGIIAGIAVYVAVKRRYWFW